MQRFVVPAVSFVVAMLAASTANAQLYESVGTRAQGMAGAFVAVADDATATWWNPAGLAAGAYFNAILERGSTTQPAERTPDGPAWRSDFSGFAVAFPALGLSYYRVRVSEISGPTPIADLASDRHDPEAAGGGLRAVVTSEFGATVGQSLGNHLVIASTLKLVRGGSATSTSAGAGDPLDAAADLETSSDTETDVDVGAMATFGPARVGFAVKHLREPAFSDGVDRVRLGRQARVGLAVTARETVTVALDADLTRAGTALGDVRHVAAGAEAWLLQRRFGLRGGVSANTVGNTTRSGSVGLSVAPRAGLYLDGAWTFGSDRSRKGWAVGLRLTI